MQYQPPCLWQKYWFLIHTNSGRIKLNLKPMVQPILLQAIYIFFWACLSTVIRIYSICAYMCISMGGKIKSGHQRLYALI